MHLPLTLSLGALITPYVWMIDWHLHQNALGDYTNIVITSYLPSQTVRKRLTPSLSTSILYPTPSCPLLILYQKARVVPWVIDELRYAFDAALPECDGKDFPYATKDKVRRSMTKILEQQTNGQQSSLTKCSAS